MRIEKANALEIGVGWAGKSGMSIRVSTGFEQEIKSLVPGIRIEYKKEVASIEDLGKIVKKWEKEKKAMVLLRSTAAVWLGKNPPSIPTFIGGGNHPRELGAIKRLGRPEGNITGVSYHLRKGPQFGIFRTIVPDLKSIFLLLEKDHPSSPIDDKYTQKICKKLGITYKRKYFDSVEEIVKTIEQNKALVSGFVIGNQALIFDHTEIIVKAAQNTPVLSYNKNSIKKGALCGFVADDFKLGRMLAQSLFDVLIKGKAIKDVKVKFDENPKFYVNIKMLKKFGFSLPEKLRKRAILIY